MTQLQSVDLQVSVYRDSQIRWNQIISYYWMNIFFIVFDLRWVVSSRPSNNGFIFRDFREIRGMPLKFAFRSFFELRKNINTVFRGISAAGHRRLIARCPYPE